jgi:hypothetical protein
MRVPFLVIFFSLTVTIEDRRLFGARGILPCIVTSREGEAADEQEW